MVYIYIFILQNNFKHPQNICTKKQLIICNGLHQGFVSKSSSQIYEDRNIWFKNRPPFMLKLKDYSLATQMWLPMQLWLRFNVLCDRVTQSVFCALAAIRRTLFYGNIPSVFWHSSLSHHNHILNSKVIYWAITEKIKFNGKNFTTHTTVNSRC